MPEADDPWSPLLARVGTDKDAEAFRALFDHFAPRLKSRFMKTGASPSAADDIVQETFIAIWRRADSYDPAKASAAAWIFTVARNKQIDAVRKETRPEPDMNDPAFVRESEQDAGEHIDAQQSASIVRQAIAAPPDAQRAVLLKSYFDEESHSEIADSLRLPIGTVKSRIRLALEKLQTLLPQHFKDDLT